MKITRKMPCGLTEDGRLTPHSEFVIPHLSNSLDSGFRGLKSGKIYEQAGMTFVGREITATDILSQLRPPEVSSEAESRLDSFVAALAPFKIGNVISIEYSPDGGFSLTLERVAARAAKRKKLP